VVHQLSRPLSILAERGPGQPGEERVYTREAPITRKDGQRRMCRFTSSRLPDDTRVVLVEDIHDTAEFIGGGPPELAEELAARLRRPVPALCWVDCEGDLLLAGYNRAAAALGGARLEGCLAAGAAEFHAEAPEVVAEIRRCLAGGGTLRKTHPLAFPPGHPAQPRALTFTFCPPNYVFVEIEEEAGSDGTLLDSFAAFADILPEIVFETDLAGRITFINQRGVETLGHTPEDWPERPLVFDFLAPGERPRAEANFRRVMAGEFLGAHEYRLRRRDGSTFPALLSSARVAHGGTPAGTCGFIVDLTARENHLQALKESEMRLRTATEGAQVGLWEWDLTTGAAWCNDQYFLLLGYTPWEFEPSFEKWLEMLHPDDLKSAERRVRRKLLQGAAGPYTDEYRLRAKDGDFRWIQDFGRVVARDAAGAPALAMGIHIDVTKRKRAEEALRTSEQMFSTAFHAAANSGAIVSIAEGRFVDVNSSICEMLGYRREELLGYNVYELGIWAEPDARARFVAMIEDQGSVTGHAFRFRTKSGEVRSGLISAAAITLKGESCLISSVEDLTERIKAEEALRASEQKFSASLHAGANASAIVSLKEGRFIEVNSGVCALTGYDHAEMIGKTVTELGIWAEPEERQRLVRLLMEQGLVRNFEYRLRRKSGEIRHALAMASRVEIDGEPCMVSEVVDLTEKRAVEEALRDSEQKFAAAFHGSASATSIQALDGQEAGRFIDVNEGVCVLTGYGREELLGKSALELAIWADPGERLSMIRTLDEKGVVRSLAFRLRRKSGEIRHGLLYAALVDLKGGRLMITSVVDITEQQQAAEALAASEERLRLATESAAIGLWDWNAETGAIHCNEVYYTMLGYAPDEFEQRHARWEEMVHPSDRERALQALAAAKSGRSDGFSEEYRMRCKDGSFRWIADTGRIVARAADGSVLRAIGIHIDVTERKRAEETLRASEEKFSKAFHASPNGFAITTFAEGRYVDANLAECEMNGYRREEMIGKTVFELGLWADQEDGRRLRRALAESGAVHNFEIRFRPKSGEIRHGLMSAALVDIDGVPCIIGEIADLTDRLAAEAALRQSEQRLRMATAGANIGLWDWDLTTGGLYCNEQYFKMLGLTPDPSTSSFEWWRGLIHPEDRERAESHARERLLEGNGPYAINYRMRTRDGSWRCIHDMGLVVERAAGGRPLRAIGIHTDITERRRAEAALRGLNEELEQRVAERTATLEKTNLTLQQQASRRLKAETALRAKEKLLKRKSADVMEVNAALKVLLKKREEDRLEVEQQIGAHLKNMVLPYIEKLKRGMPSARNQANIGVIESNLREIASPFAKVLMDKMYSFTPTEIQIANFIKLDKSNKEIAGYLNLSVKTIEYHRYNIRRKLGLINKPVNLRTYLQTMK
jgi:PAS domain S-box-containing protein